MIFTTEQLKSLEPYEKHFRTAIRSKYAMYPGSNGVQLIHRTYNDATKSTMHLNASCSSCIFRLLVECGTIYFKDKQELEQMQTEIPKRTRRKS